MKKKIFFLLMITVFLWHASFTQQIDSTKKIRYFAGAVNITNNGISLIPTFSLGKPAAIFNLSMGNNKLSFEPEFRFALEGKPWSFVFWWRYKLANTNRFKFNIGAHPALVFKTTSIIENGVQKNIIEAQRFAAAELSPYYMLTKNTSIGMYYLYGHGFENEATQNTHFITLNSNFSNIKLSKQVFMRFSPQVYYLKMDNNDGFFFTGAVALAHKRSPFAIASVINKVITTNISTSQDIVWNITLSYSFYHNYLKQ